MSSKTAIIISREYKERVQKKSFIITTILMPLFMLAMMVVPVLIATMTGHSDAEILVIDRSGKIATKLESDADLKFLITAAPLDSALARQDVSAVLVIPADVVANRKNPGVKYYTNGPSSMLIEGAVTRQLNRIIEQERLKEYDIDNLQEILADVKTDVALTTLRNDRDSEESISSGLSYGIGIGMAFVLYMFVLIYGQMVMTSIIEEKNNRVLELMVSSVKPMQLMMGKILGIAAVAVTQILIWGVLTVVMSAFVLPALVPADIMADAATLQAGGTLASTDNLELVQAVSMIGSVGFVVKLFACLTAFLVLGFLFYSAIFAAIGSAVDNIQDASQLQTIVVVPVILGIVFAMTAATDPMTPLSVWMSMIPFTSPMVMMARVAYGIPSWEIWLSLAILAAGFVGMVWVAGKVYRIGIFMYGKKPTLKDLIRWARYK